MQKEHATHCGRCPKSSSLARFYVQRWQISFANMSTRLLNATIAAHCRPLCCNICSCVCCRSQVACAMSSLLLKKLKHKFQSHEHTKSCMHVAQLETRIRSEPK